ncbi:MAG TPA: SRPBCC family protein [Polyangia bacterium]|nr:SRPBCC family protein [Polyangia bacterium]
MIDVTLEVLIHRPRPTVAAFMFEPRNDQRWTSGVVACRPLTDGPLRAGSRVERTAKFLGRRFAYEYLVTDADPERFVEMRVTQPFPMQIRYTLDDAPDGTVTRIRAQGEPSGFFRLASALVAPMVRRNIGKDLQNLKALLEAA